MASEMEVVTSMEDNMASTLSIGSFGGRTCIEVHGEDNTPEEVEGWSASGKRIKQIMAGKENGFKMAADQANAPSSAPRLRFSKSDDLDLLRDVRDCNPFEDMMRYPMRWTEIAVRLSAARGKVFSARTVHDRTDLLLTQYADKDSKSLRRSGTEEEYEEQDKLLQELLDMARENRYRYRRIRKTCGKQSSSGTDNATPSLLFDHMITGNGDTAIVLDEQQQQVPMPAPTICEELSDVAASPSPSSPAGSVILGDTRNTQELQVARNEPVRNYGKRTQGGKQETADFQFLEKRMKHDEFMKEKDFIIESRRLKLEEDRLAWEKEKALIESELRGEERKLKAEQLAEERRERAEERRMAAAQQQAFLSVLENIVTKVNK
ncbi:hypothetical protein HPB49_003533 [Dermacentor silvarum]|uniref:Uncharacterized protein n=1 Tax=Dermacentor silvarum TaxID=543639 RepID=A0ACB8CDA7_DERSI|nr:hypothetical protein HPB49_003533 [Dermacentor silvarum]